MIGKKFNEKKNQLVCDRTINVECELLRVASDKRLEAIRLLYEGSSVE